MTSARYAQGRFHYAWIVVAVIFLALLAAGGVRSTPAVLMVPLEDEFGWSRATISAAVSVNIFLYGLMGPFAAALMQRFGIRRSATVALVVVALAMAASTLIAAPWQLMLTWGLFTGMGVGVVALVMGATVVNRWFTTNRGLAMGVLTASTASGQLVFLPMLAYVAGEAGWRASALIMSCAALAVIPLILWLVPENPRDVGLLPSGATSADDLPKPSTANPAVVALQTLAMASRSRDFWLLFASFFVCGLSTNGLIGTHLIAACIDVGIPEIQAAGLLAMMGIFDLVGTTASGWLTDRYDSRKLLFMYYGLRGISLIYLPYSGYTFYGLSLFAVFYGLDWIATVPPTLRLVNDAFGRDNAPIVFGWIACGHQMGAATAAFGAGWMRTATDGYLESFIIAGVVCVATAVLVLFIGRGRETTGTLQPLPAAV